MDLPCGKVLVWVLSREVETPNWENLPPLSRPLTREGLMKRLRRIYRQMHGHVMRIL